MTTRASLRLLPCILIAAAALAAGCTRCGAAPDAGPAISNPPAATPIAPVAAYYVGLTDDLERRLAEHNEGKTFSTRDDRPWKITCYFWFENADTAERFDRYLKSGSGRAFAGSHFG